MTTNHAQAVDLTIRDRLLDALTISSGAVDAISFLAFGRVFTAFMTGNLVFLGLRVGGAPAPSAVAIITAILAFALGVFVSTRIVTGPAPSGAWPHRVTVALGISLLAHAGFLAIWLVGKGEPSSQAIIALIAVWGMAMGIQSAAVRALHVDGVFTTAATATVIFLAGDLANWPATGVERRRLVAILLSLFVGAAAGALLFIRTPMYAPLLPFGITAAVIVTASIGMERAQGLTRAGRVSQSSGRAV
jgi:uncharacterized membrane protein YoaK (UPF0700 family)